MTKIKLKFMRIVLKYIQEKSPLLTYDCDKLINEIENKLEEE